MKRKVFLSLMFLIVSMFLSMFLYVSSTTAEHEPHTQWGLPEGAKARLGKGGINDITCTSDGTLLAVASQIGIWIYDIQTSEALVLLTGHTGAVDRIAFSPDGKHLASGGQDNTVRLWDVDTQTEIGTLEGHTGGPNSIWFSPDGKTIASRDDDKTLRLWDVETQTQIHTLEGYIGTVESVSFSPDGRTLASGGQDNIVRMWDVDTQTEISTLEGHTEYVGSVSFSPDGKTIVSGSHDGTVRLWEVGTQTEIAILQGHTDAVLSVAFSPGSKTFASGSRDGTVRIWDVATQTEIAILEVTSSIVARVSFSPDGKTIACEVGVGGTWHDVRIWDVATQTRIIPTLKRFQTTNNLLVSIDEDIWEFLWVVDALVDAHKKNIEHIYDEHTDAVLSVAFSPDGKTIAASDGDYSNYYNHFIRMWNVGTLTEIDIRSWWGRSFGITRVAFSPDGKTILSMCGQQVICLRDAATYTEIRTLEIPAHWVNFAVFSPDGHTLAIGGNLDIEIVWLWDVDTDTEIGILWEHIGVVKSVSFSPDGRTLATAGSVDGTVRLWDVETQTQIAILRGHTGWVNSIAFSSDGKTIVSGSNDRTVRLWDAETQTEIGTLEGHTAAVNSVSFSPSGKTIASGSNDNTVMLWDVGTQTGMGTLKGHIDAVNSVAFSPNGKTVASGSDDSTVLLWNITSLPATQERIPEDINADGTVNIQDLVLVAANIGETGQNTADVNGDGTVNILDLTRVAGALGTVASSPANPQRKPALTPTRAQLLQWLTQARQMNRTDPTFQRGIRMLERLLAALTPKETALLANYPNPFNPETWIPYQLSKPTDVTLRIYAVDGKLVRLLDLGHQHAGIYHSRSRAAYWDGRNQIGEPVASGLYFYTLTAGEFTATRKLLIRK